MAIYHFSAKIISRANGSSALAAAAYRSASRLHDVRLERHHDFSNKAGVVHSEVLLPDGAPEHLADREGLWNAVEAAELRKDAQLAREIEFALPRELDQTEAIRLAREFVSDEFVSRGMVADLSVHWDRGADGELKPHAHVMLTTRAASEEGFGTKVRDWNRTELLTHWREAWADHVNARLAELDIDVRVDHRSLAAQGIELEPQHKVGPAGARRLERGEDAERAADHLRIARENGEKIIAQPEIALTAVTQQQATFTRADMYRFLHRHTVDQAQFDEARAAVRQCPELVRLGTDGRGEMRFTSREMIEIEQRLERATRAMAEREQHGVGGRYTEAALARAEARGLSLSNEQRDALKHVTDAKDLGIVIGYAGTGKSAMLGVAREAWEEAGYAVRGAALSGIAAENLESGSGIASRTIASLEHQWGQGRELLTAHDVLVIDEAGMIGTRQMERVLSEASARGAKVVLVGDPEQLQAIEAGAAFRGIVERHGGVEITSVRRQREDWQRDATRQLATGRTDEAISAYAERGHVHAAATRDDARAELVERWNRERRANPDASRLILTHTRDEVRALNELARERLREVGELGQEIAIETTRGERLFASGDRVMFLRNERELGVKNGTVGTVQSVDCARMAVMLDDGRSVAFDVKDYTDLDHGYAATIHKAQGVTVDRVHVLATSGLDRHAAYVALSRHRDTVDLHYGREDFADQGRLVRTLSRERAKDLASDYADPAQAFAERRGITLRRRIVDVVRRITPEPVRELAAAMRAAASAPQRDPKQHALAVNKLALVRHARAVDAIFQMQEQGLRASPAQLDELKLARRQVDGQQEHAARDLEAVYKRTPQLVFEAADGNVRRAVVAMQLEAELRTNPLARADEFVKRWQKLSAKAEQAYVGGNMATRKAIRSDMAAMAKSLERDPQLESILAGRKQALGIAMDAGRSLGVELAFSRGLDLGRGRGLGL